MGTVTVPLDEYLSLNELRNEFNKDKEIVYIEHQKFFGVKLYMPKDDAICKLVNEINLLQDRLAEIDNKLSSARRAEKNSKDYVSEFEFKINSMSVFDFIKYKFSL